MKKIILLAVLLLPVFALCQINTENSTVQVVGYWDKNEKQTYDFTYLRAFVKGVDTTVVESTRYKVDITVVDSTNNSYTINWKYHDIITDKGSDVVKRVAALNEGRVFQFTTDEMGSFKQLLNWEEAKKHNDNTLRLFEKSDPPEMYQKISAVMRTKFATREAIETHSIKDILLFYGFHGIALDINETLEETIEENNPYSQKPIKSLASLEVSEVDAENGTFIVKFWQDFDSNNIAGILEDTFQEIKGQDALAKKIAAADMEKLNMELKDYTGAMMHESGWPVNIHYQRVMGIETGELQNFEIRTIVIE